MKVLMFGWEYPPYNSGGLGVACEGLSRALASENIDITFVLPRPFLLSSPDISFVFADSKRIKMRPIDVLISPYMTPSSYEGVRRYQPGDYGSDLFEEVLRYSLYAKEVAKKETFDVIHAHEWLSFGAGLAAKELSGKPLIVHVHATEFDRSAGHVNDRVYHIEKEAFEKADTIIAVSDYTKQIIMSQYGTTPNKIITIYNGVEPFDDHPDPSQEKIFNLPHLKAHGQKIVLFVGRLTLQKGADYFLRAAQKALDYDNTITFIIAGSGDMERQLIEEAARLGITDHVYFTGFLRDKELKELYRGADLFILPSISEPFGISALEALINGTPVIVSKQSGVAQALTHVLKVDFWDTEELAHKILAVLSYRSLMQELSQNGFAEASKLTWQQAAKKCIELYDKLTRHY